MLYQIALVFSSVVLVFLPCLHAESPPHPPSPQNPIPRSGRGIYTELQAMT
jgi:hypothetical protein